MTANLIEEYFGTEDLSNDEPSYYSGRPDPWERRPTTPATLNPIQKPTDVFTRGFGVAIQTDNPVSSEWIIGRYQDTFHRLLEDFGFVTIENPLPVTKLPTQKVGQGQTLLHFDDGASYSTRRYYKMTLLTGSTDVHSQQREVPLWVVDSEAYRPKICATIDEARRDISLPQKCQQALDKARELLDANPAALNKITELTYPDGKKTDPEIFDLLLKLEKAAFYRLRKGKYVHGYELGGFCTTRHIVSAASGLACAPKVAHGKLLADPNRVPVEAVLFPIIPDTTIEGDDALERWMREF